MAPPGRGYWQRCIQQPEHQAFAVLAKYRMCLCSPVVVLSLRQYGSSEPSKSRQINTTEAQKVSEALRDSPPVDLALIQATVKAWKSTGFLQ